MSLGSCLGYFLFHFLFSFFPVTPNILLLELLGFPLFRFLSWVFCSRASLATALYLDFSRFCRTKVSINSFSCMAWTLPSAAALKELSCPDLPSQSPYSLILSSCCSFSLSPIPERPSCLMVIDSHIKLFPRSCSQHPGAPNTP